MESRRVAVTGLGVVSALGPTRADFWDALCQGRSGIGPIEGLDTSAMAARNGAQIRGFDPAVHFSARDLLLLDRFAQLSVLAAREALADAGPAWSDALRERSAIVTGCAMGGQGTQENTFEACFARGRMRLHPLSIPRVMSHAGAAQIATEFQLFGPMYNVSTACASSAHAIGQAFWLVRSGVSDLAVCGGAETPFSPVYLQAWEALRALDPTTCRPFSRDRRGTILGEGSAMLVLEDLDRARARGARIYGEVTGFGMSSDAYHITQPSELGAVRAMRMALRDAGQAADEVDYVNAHGTGTELNDRVESGAIRAVFGPAADRLWVSSTKSMHGHVQGGAGALEMAATLLAMHDGIVPPTVNYTEADPDCALDVVPNESRKRRIRAALSNSFAFGGTNAVLALRSLSH